MLTIEAIQRRINPAIDWRLPGTRVPYQKAPGLAPTACDGAQRTTFVRNANKGSARFLELPLSHAGLN